MKTDASRFIATAALLWGALIAAAKCAGLYLDMITQPVAARAFHDASIGLLVSGGLLVFCLGVMALCLRLGRWLHLRAGAGAGPAARPVQTNGSVPGAEVIRFSKASGSRRGHFVNTAVTWGDVHKPNASPEGR